MRNHVKEGFFISITFKVFGVPRTFFQKGSWRLSRRASHKNYRQIRAVAIATARKGLILFVEFSEFLKSVVLSFSVSFALCEEFFCLFREGLLQTGITCFGLNEVDIACCRSL